jgi:ADP-ribosyl-[dinitrogen reductase] hydrolase
MALILGESLFDNQGLNSADLTQRYLDWHQTDAFDTGPIWRIVFSFVASGMSATEAAQKVHKITKGMTAGVNTAHRSVAIGCASCIADEAVAEVARQEAKLTHWHDDASEASAATAVIIRALLRGASLDEAVESGVRCTTGLVQTLLSTPVTPSSLSQSGHAPLTLQTALYFVKSSSSFAEALARSIDFAGLENYCPVLVGAFAAALWGAEELADYPVHRDLLEQTAACFTKLWQPSL